MAPTKLGPVLVIIDIRRHSPHPMRRIYLLFTVWATAFPACHAVNRRGFLRVQGDSQAPAPCLPAPGRFAYGARHITMASNWRPGSEDHAGCVAFGGHRAVGRAWRCRVQTAADRVRAPSAAAGDRRAGAAPNGDALS